MGLTGTMEGGVRGGALTLSELMFRLQKTCVCFILEVLMLPTVLDEKEMNCEKEARFQMVFFFTQFQHRFSNFVVTVIFKSI